MPHEDPEPRPNQLPEPDKGRPPVPNPRPPKPVRAPRPKPTPRPAPRPVTKPGRNIAIEWARITSALAFTPKPQNSICSGVDAMIRFIAP